MRRALLLPALSLLAAASLAAPPAFAGHGGGEEKKAPPSYFALQPLTATALRRDGRKGVMTLEAGIEAKDAKLMDYAQKSEPRLRAAFAEVLMSYTAGMPRGTPPDLNYLGGKLQDAADKVLGRKGSKVLLGSAMVN